jgi:hypothetical protein
MLAKIFCIWVTGGVWVLYGTELRRIACSASIANASRNSKIARTRQERRDESDLCIDAHVDTVTCLEFGERLAGHEQEDFTALAPTSLAPTEAELKL